MKLTSKQKKDIKVVEFLDKKVSEGWLKKDAIDAAKKRFFINSHVTIYNTIKRVREQQSVTA